MIRANANRDAIELSTFFSLSPDLLCIAEQTGTILKTNMAWKDLMGYEPESMKDKNIFGFLHPSERKQTLAAVRKNLRANGSVVSYESRIKDTRGAYHDLEWRAIRRDDLIYATARDVTERRQSENNLRQLSKAVEYNPAAIVITDSDGVITYVNNKFTELTGYEPNEALGKKPSIVKSGKHNRTFYTQLWKTISSGKSWQGFFQNRKKDGSLYWESAKIAPILDKSGKIITYVAIKEDISLRKNNEDELRRRNKLLNLFFQQSLDGFFFMMLDQPVEWNESTDKKAALDYVFSHQRITRANQAMLDCYGAQENEFIGRTPADFYRHDIDSGKELWKRLFDQGRLHVDFPIRKFDGSPMTIEGDYICLYDEQDRIIGHFGVQRDISFERGAKKKLKESEERFRQLAENINQVFFLRTKSKMLYVSPAYEKIFGRSCKSLYDNPESYQEVIHPEDMKKIECWYTEEKSEYEYRVILPDGDERWIRTSTFPVPSFSGEPQRIAGIASDVSVSKRLEQQLRETSNRDALTGLYNRRYLYEILDALLEKVEREDELFSVAILDIDQFKAINDTYGHIAGDSVLKELSKLLLGSIRKYDTLGRFGGEEFLILFTGTTKDKAHRRMERILEKVRKMSVPYEGTEIRFTLSCGIADSSICVHESCSIELIINEADTKLYQAKKAGKNRIHSS